MRIYALQTSDLMLTDSVAGLNAIASRVAQFLDSEDQSMLLEADTSPTQWHEGAFLHGLELRKASGPILVALDAISCVRLSGSVENLRVWARHLKFPDDAVDGDHHHPEYVHREDYLDPRTLSVIIEVQEEDGDAP